MKNIKHSIVWWYWIIGIDLFLLFITTLYPYLPHFHGDRILIYPFNLANENNLAVWWSGVCLFATALLTYEICCNSEDHLKKAWLCLTILLLGLSKDEISSIHERIDGFRNLLPYAICAVALLAYSLTKLFKHANTRKSAIYIFIAFLIFGSVAFQEFLEHLIRWPEWATGIRVGVEEGSELAGVFLLFLGISFQKDSSLKNNMKAIIPNISRMKYVSAFLLLEFIIHSLASFLFPKFFDIYQKKLGNPLTWFPMAVFFILFSASFWRTINPKGTYLKTWSLFSVLFLLFSAGAMYNPIKLIFKLCYIIPVNLQTFLFHASMLATIIFFRWRLSSIVSLKNSIFFVFLMATICLEFFLKDYSWQSFLFGTFVYTIAIFFMFTTEKFAPLKWDALNIK
jgi:hypothetical protein